MFFVKFEFVVIGEFGNRHAFVCTLNFWTVVPLYKRGDPFISVGFGIDERSNEHQHTAGHNKKCHSRHHIVL